MFLFSEKCWSLNVCLALLIFCLFGCNAGKGSGDGSLLIVALGDSITKGERSGVSSEHTYPSILQDLLHEANQAAEILNQGIPREQTNGALVRWDRDFVSYTPDYVLIMYGTNDAFIDEGQNEPRLSSDEYEKNLRALVQKAKDAGAVPVLLTPPPMGKRCYATEFEPYKTRNINFKLIEYIEICRIVAKDQGTILVDIFGLWQDKQAQGTNIDRWLTDGMHPNPEGHGLIAKQIMFALANELEQSKTGIVDLQSPKYTIPTLDLAAQKHRQVEVDREPGQYLGHPTTVLLEDNQTMFTVYPKGHGRGGIVMKSSNDAGLTWTERLPTPENWATSLEVPTLHRVINAHGVKRIIMFSGLYPIRMAFTEDGGENWTQLEPIGDFGGIVAMGCVEHLKNGDYIAMFHDDGRFIHGTGKTTGIFTLYKTISQDGGLTWSAPIEILSGSQVHLCEPGIFRSPDGQQLAVLLRENSRTRNSYVIFSTDEGQTWTEPRELPASLTGDRHTGRYAPDGRLFISFRDRTHLSPTWGDWVAWVGTYEDIVNGHEGQYRIRLMNNTQGADCAYPGVEVLPDGTFITTTYGHWLENEEPFIVCLRLRLDELDEMLKNGAVMAADGRFPD